MKILSEDPEYMFFFLCPMEFNTLILRCGLIARFTEMRSSVSRV